MAKEKILLVEKDAAILRICTLYLQAEHFEVISMAEAQPLVETVAAEHPDMVILDINKTSSPAIQSLREFRYQRDFTNIPVLVLIGSEAVRQLIYSDEDLLPDEHLAKPFVTEELVARINALLRIKKFIERGYDPDALYSIRQQTSKLAMRR